MLKLKSIEPIKFFVKKIIIEKIAALKKTEILKTAIIDKEWIPRLYIDIFDGPKYLRPLVELIVWSGVIHFFTVPEKLLHKLSSFESVMTSFFVKQL